MVNHVILYHLHQPEYILLLWKYAIYIIFQFHFIIYSIIVLLKADIFLKIINLILIIMAAKYPTESKCNNIYQTIILNELLKFYFKYNFILFFSFFYHLLQFI